jgi:hypothetical protein
MGATTVVRLLIFISIPKLLRKNSGQKASNIES